MIAPSRDRGRPGRFESLARAAGSAAVPGIVLLALLLLTSCARGSVQPPSPRPDPIIELGTQFITWGGILAGLALVAGIARFFAFATGPLGWILGLAGPFLAPAGYLGASAVGVGYAIRWVGYHPWLVALAAVAAGLALWLHRHPAVGRRLVAWANDRTQALKKPKSTEPARIP
jgi:hypothetical protein